MIDEGIRNKGVIATNLPADGKTDSVAAELQRLKRTLEISSRAAEIFLSVSDDSMYGEVLQVILEATRSKQGVFGYIDEKGDLVCPSMTRDVWQECQMPDKSVRFPRNSWTDEQWCRALRSNRTLYQNKPGRVPKGHVLIHRSASIPIAYQGDVVGLLQVGNKATDYDADDVALLEDIGGQIAPILHARLERDRQEREGQRVQELPREREWLLTRDARPVDSNEEDYVPRCGDVTQLSTCREVIDAVGERFLRTVVSECLYLVDTSAAVYEKNGDYVLGLVASGWCQLLDAASRDRCRTEDNAETLRCGKWFCHESCWTDASKAAIESGRPTDIECNGGIRLYAVPIWAGNKVVGSVNFAYGDPPNDVTKLRKIAETYSLPVDWLCEEAKKYGSRPPYLIAAAKKRLLSSARLIGAIIERTRTERALKESESQFRSTFEQAAVGIAHVALDGRWLRVNQRLCEIFGYSREELVQLTFQDITHVDDLGEDLECVRRILTGEIDNYSLEKRYVHKSGSIVWINLTVSLLEEDSGEPKYFVFVVEDISARKKAEFEVEDIAKFPSENPYAVFRVTKDGEIIYANPAAEALVNDPGRNTNEEAAAVWRQKTLEALQAETRLMVEIVSGGSTLSFLVVPIVDAGYANWYGRDVTEQREAESVASRAQTTSLEQQRGETARIASELEKVREELVRKTRLAAIGQVSASIAHDLRNPLGAARNAAYWLKRHVPKDEPQVSEFLQIIEDEVGRSDAIIRGLLEVSQSRPASKQAVELSLLAHDAFRQVADAEGVRFRVVTASDPCLIHADPDQFRLVLINLLDNAVQAIEGKGDLVVQATRNEEYDVIVVRDNGPGISIDVQSEVFEPLVTTKATGTGLGLTICHQVIQTHGGTIQLVRDGQPGAAFRIELPRGENQAQVSPRTDS